MTRKYQFTFDFSKITLEEHFEIQARLQEFLNVSNAYQTGMVVFSGPSVPTIHELLLEIYRMVDKFTEVELMDVPAILAIQLGRDFRDQWNDFQRDMDPESVWDSVFDDDDDEE